MRLQLVQTMTRLLATILLAKYGVALAIGSPLETPDFDVQSALYEQGVDVSSIPQLNDLREGTLESSCHAACGALSHLYGPERVLSQNTTGYQNVSGSYWSMQQEEVRPSCMFIPAVDTDVSILVLLSRLTSCPFAAKSGGHAAFAGASSSPDGITVLFRDLNEVTLSEDMSIAYVGPGNTWGQVYTTLQPHGLAVVGGRVTSIGVGGLTTGGGISYYSNLYGWALDNVESFEVVTATGAIVTASETQHPDLYWALRGGGNNFGLVTKFNLYTFPGPLLRGTTRVFTEDKVPSVISAFIDVVNNASVDGNAQQYVAFGRLEGINIASAELTYVQNVSNPAIFQPYRSIAAISDTTATRTLAEYCAYIQASNRDGLREVYWNISVRLDEDFTNWLVQYFYSVISQVDNVAGVLPVLVIQALTEPILRKMSKYGGNALGLDPSTGPIQIVHISCWWDNASDDDTVYGFVNRFFEGVAAHAKDVGVENEYIYMNYASQFQDVIASYGAANKARLQDIASRYDPSGVYQSLQPGYFKLTRAPVPDPY